MKKLLLTLALMLGLGTTSLKADNFYVAGFAGTNWIQDYLKHIDLNTKIGYTYGGSFGYKWACSGWRVEGEFAYRKNTINHFKFRRFSTGAHGRQSYTSGMGNIFYDFCLPNTWITPFIGAGIGWYEQKINIKHHHLHGVSKSNDLAWQVLAGISYEINLCYSVALSYCLLKPEDKFYIHSARLGVAYNF